MRNCAEYFCALLVNANFNLIDSCELLECCMENFTELLDFNIRHISFLGFNSGNHIFIHITTDELKLMSEVPLRKIVAVTEFNEIFTDEVLSSWIWEWFWQITSLPVLSHFLHFFKILLVNMSAIGCKSETKAAKNIDSFCLNVYNRFIFLG